MSTVKGSKDTLFKETTETINSAFIVLNGQENTDMFFTSPVSEPTGVIFLSLCIIHFFTCFMC